MLVLAIDSAGAGCSACVWRDGQVLALLEEKMERGQDQRLMPLILAVLKRASVDFPQLDRIAVTRGPGSFTGLRIGLAAARGIGLAANKPVIGIDRFSVYRAAFPEMDLLVMIESRRKELFCRYYPADAPAHDPVMMVPDDIAAFLKTAPGAGVTGDRVVPGLAMKTPRDKEAVLCAALAAKADADDPAYLPRPLYLRAPDVTFPKAGRGEAFRIEAISMEQAPLLVALHAGSFTPAWNLEQLHGSLALDTTRGWLVTGPEGPAGFILCQMLPDEAEILTLCVRTEDRRRGIGERLLRQATEAARAEGSQLFLEVSAGNAAAIGLYRKFGFRNIGTRPGYYHDSNMVNTDALLFEWP